MFSFNILTTQIKCFNLYKKGEQYADNQYQYPYGQQAEKRF